MQLSEEMLTNRSYSNTPLHFSPLLPETVTPPGITDPMEARAKARQIPTGALVQSNGDVLFRMYAPNAHSVEVLFETQKIRVELEKKEDGLWEALFPYRFSGPKATEWRVDGTYVLHPYANIYFSYNRAVNYVDIPDPEMDYVLIRDVPHGSVTHEYYWSNATENWQSCTVYTPPGYQQSGETYPVLYLQHGAGEGETSWIWNGKTNFILDNLIAEGGCVPFIVVMNDGMVRTKADEGGFMRSFNGFASMLLDDCMPFIESRYRVRTDKWSRAMAGLSMGSMQTSIIGMNHPELFGYLGLFSGFMGSAMRMGDRKTEQPHLAAIHDKAKFEADYKVFFRGIGQDDALYAHFAADDELCERYGVDPANLSTHVRRIYPGVHDWNVWRRCLHDFAQLIFR